ncbi:MAG TPA: ParB N-terminal domain-containing protein [Thermoanaerobaculia bacterium]|nr:ParB N-terminal domain-containing protein [Thermoanaerobaculia bacterium]
MTQNLASPRLEALDRLVPDPDQPRKRFPEGPLAELAKDIWTHGLNQPVTVTPDPENEGVYRLFIGERRWRAFQINREQACRLFEAGEELPPDHPAHSYERWTVIPVLDAPQMDPVDRLLRQVSENDQREDLTLYERALAYQRALSLSGLKAKEFAARKGIDAGTLSTYKGLINAKGPTKLALELGLINDASAARLFQSLPTEQQEELLQRAEEDETTLSRVIVQRTLDTVEEAKRRIEQAKAASEEAGPAAVSEEPSPEVTSGEARPATTSEASEAPGAVTPPREASTPAPGTPAAPPPVGPVISVETLNWLHNHLERLEPGEDEPLRQEALAALQQAVLNDSPFIAIREGAPAPPMHEFEEALQEA